MSGLIIKKFRDENNYSQSDLAQILGVSTRSIGRWEQNKSKPSNDELKKLASLIKCEEEDILSDNNPLTNPQSEAVNTVLLEKISESVDNLVTGQEIINSSLTTSQEILVTSKNESNQRQDEIIEELKIQNKQVLEKLREETEIIESYKRELQANKTNKSTAKIQVMILVVMCLILALLLFSFWILWRNNFFSSELIEGEPVLGESTTWIIEDDK